MTTRHACRMNVGRFGLAIAAALWAIPVAAGPRPVGRDEPVGRSRPGPSAADSREAIDLLRDELADVRREVFALSEELRRLRALVAGADGRPTLAGLGQPSRADTQEPAAVPPEMVQAQVEELAQVKVESASKFPVTLAGTLLSNTVYNTGDSNWLENPNLVGTASGGSMTSTMRQSRIGLDVHGIPIGAWEAKGALILDFFGGTPGFINGPVMGLPRLIYAFGRLERGGTAIQIGQDHAMLAPRDPTSLAALAFPQFFRTGNLYLRAPQVRVEQKFGGGFLARGGIVAPIAGDAGTSYVFAPVAGGGERSERPALQGHLGYAAGTVDSASQIELGVSGHHGWIRQTGRLIQASAGAFDFNVRTGRVGMAGEAYVADELDAYGSGVGQPGRSQGGWVEGRLLAATRVSLNGGVGLDHRPDGVGLAGRLRNRSAFGNVILRLTPEVAASLEYKWLQTQYGSGRNRETHHLNAVFAVTF